MAGGHGDLVSNSVEDIALYPPEELFAEAIVEEVITFFTNDPGILSIAAVDSTHVRVTFAQPLISNAALMCAGVYSIVPNDPSNPSITVMGVETEGDPVESVLLTTTEHYNLGDYVLSIAMFEVA